MPNALDAVKPQLWDDFSFDKKAACRYGGPMLNDIILAVAQASINRQQKRMRRL